MDKPEIDPKTGLWKEPQPYDFSIGAGNTAAENTDRYCNDGLDYEVDYMADIDDMYAHYFTPYQIADRMDYEPKSAHYYKYHEEEILKDIE